MAILRNVAISLLHLDGHANIAAANRHHARDLNDTPLNRKTATHLTRLTHATPQPN